MNPQKSGMHSASSKAGKRDVGRPHKGNRDSNQKQIFIKKLQACMQIYDYNQEKKDVKGKNQRLNAINGLQQMLQTQKNVTQLILPNLDSVISMIEKNIFRPLPNIKKGGGLAFSETGIQTEEEVDPSWPYLQGIYEFFVQLILNQACDAKAIKMYITPQFIHKFLELFDSEEPNEREYLKTILHKIYAKVVPRRKMIRKAFSDTFYDLIHEKHKFNGTAEILDILAAIISGFAVPLRDEHVHFFKNIIIPLHKVQTCSMFYEQLLRCSMLFLSKDRTLAVPLLDGLLKYWPFANSVKQTLFLTALQQVLEVCEIEKIEHLIPRLFKRIIRCIAGDHLQVADRAMCLFENDHFLSILKTYREVAFPVLVPTINNLAENHWHKILQESLIALRTILKEIDPYFFDEALKKAKENPKLGQIYQDSEKRSMLDGKWMQLNKKLKNSNPTFKEPMVPFKVSQMVSEYNQLYHRIYDKEKYINC